MLTGLLSSTIFFHDTSLKFLGNFFVSVAGNKRITFEEFLPIYHNVAKRDSVGSLDAFVECFRIFDIDNNGLISAGEIRHLLTVLGKFI